MDIDKASLPFELSTLAAFELNTLYADAIFTMRNKSGNVGATAEKWNFISEKLEELTRKCIWKELQYKRILDTSSSISNKNNTGNECRL